MEVSGYLEKIKMSYADAQKILASVVEGRVRWGKLYDGTSIPSAQLCDALVVFAHAENQEMAELRKQLAAANRRHAASNAREQRYKKKIAELTGKPVEEEPDEISE